MAWPSRKAARWANGSSASRPTPTPATAIKWDGEWQVTYETFRDMGHRLRGRPDPDLPAGGRPVRQLPGAADHHGADPADHHRRDARPRAVRAAQFTATSMIGMIALAGIIVRNSILLVDFIKQQVAAGMNFHDAVIQSAAVRAKPIALTALAAMLGALFILDDPIFNGLALASSSASWCPPAHAGGHPVLYFSGSLFRVVPGLYRLCRPEPGTERFHRLLSAGKLLAKMGFKRGNGGSCCG